MNPAVAAGAWCRSRRRGPILLYLAAALLLSSCAAFNGPTEHEPYLRSFLGVPFGASLADTRRIYPQAAIETSPLGFDCLRLENQFGQGISYTAVIYEFSPSAGMQVVLAGVSSESNPLVLARLQRILGPPLHGSVESPQPGPSIWLTPQGGQVSFDPASDLLIVRNSASIAFAEDVRLRIQSGTLALK
jgi:hypothetical protein